MAVTLYRCTKCRGLFNTVWDTFGGRMCRDCKLQTAGYQEKGGDPESQQVKIIEDVGEQKLLDTCNVMARPDGFNFAIKRDNGLWVGNDRLACNRPAVTIGIWHPRPANRSLTEVWACQFHAKELREYTEKPGRDWFEERGMGGGKSVISQAIGGPIGDAQDVFDGQQVALSQQNWTQDSNSVNALMQQGAQSFSGGSEIRTPFQYGRDPIPGKRNLKPDKSETESSPHDAILNPSRKIRLQE